MGLLAEIFFKDGLELSNQVSFIELIIAHKRRTGFSSRRNDFASPHFFSGLTFC